MLRAIVVLALGLSAGAVAAAPCTLETMQAAYWRHQDRPEHFVLVRGSFADLRFVKHERRKDRVIWRATFTGHAASARAFDRPFTAKVTLVDRLFTGMEGSNPDPRRLAGGLAGQEGLVFLQRDGDGYRVETEFCTPILYTDPSVVKPALDCLAGRRCPRP